MTTEVATQLSDEDLVGYIVEAYGDLNLAAERAKIESVDIYKRFPTLDHDKLLAGIKVAITIQTFNSYTQTKAVAMAMLDDFTGPQIAKYHLDLTDRLARLLEVPTDRVGAGGNTFNIINAQMVAEQSDARDKLAARILIGDVASRPDDGDRQFEPTGATTTPV